MSPEDDLPTDSRVPIEKVPLNSNWQTKMQQPKLIDPIWKTNGQTTQQQQQPLQSQTQHNNHQNQIQNQQIINGINNKDKDNNHRWSPLPQQDDNHQKLTTTAATNLANNNEWINWPTENKYKNNLNDDDDDIKNGWKDITDIDDNGLHNKSLGNNNGSLLNGNTTLGNGNGHSDKLTEDDPLTGQLRHPQEHDDDDDGSNCGIGSFQPKWAKKFASTHAFMVVFLLAWILQGMYYTYFVSVITTIEKLFQIKSKITGLLMSATEIGQISTSLFLTYYAGRGHRPRWIACGMILFAIASFGCTLPHFIYGDQLLHANNVFNGGGLKTQELDGTNMNLCHADHNRTNHNNSSYEFCEDDLLQEQEAHSQITTIVLIIFSISLLGVGVGQTAVSTLGIPYIDDNVASRESPIYIAITIGVRILGPAGGFILGSLCTRVYVSITVDPGIGPTDPKWVGAWWLGLVLVSSLMAITSLAMFTFPKTLKGNRIPPPIKLRAIQEQKTQVKLEEPKTPQLKDFPKTLKRQLSNDILMFRTASSVLHLLPVAGLYTFLPKYMESQFRLTAHDANLITGIGGILVMGVGIVISGVVILKFSPTARSVAAWIAFSAIIYSCGMVILMFVGCPMDDFKGLNKYSEPNLPKFEPVCETNCQCDTKKFSPICGSDGMIYFSSCHAGCSNSTKTGGRIEFNDCSCIPPLADQMGKPQAVGGYCDGNCKNFIFFICLFSFFVFMHSTSEVGSMLLIMRCTDPKDKAMAMGVIQFAIGLFGNVPCPIIYGSVVDSACLVWETICGKQGACSLYDVDVFRHFFLGTTAAIMLCAFVMDLVVWHKADRIDIDPESTPEIDYSKTVNVPDTSSV